MRPGASNARSHQAQQVKSGEREHVRARSNGHSFPGDVERAMQHLPSTCSVSNRTDRSRSRPRSDGGRSAGDVARASRRASLQPSLASPSLRSPVPPSRRPLPRPLAPLPSDCRGLRGGGYGRLGRGGREWCGWHGLVGSAEASGGLRAAAGGGDGLWRRCTEERGGATACRRHAGMGRGASHGGRRLGPAVTMERQPNGAMLVPPRHRGGSAGAP